MHHTAPGGVEIDLNGMMAAKDKAVRGLTSGIASLFKQNKVRLNAHVCLRYVKGDLGEGHWIDHWS